ncbi:glycosyltransferase family 2 protein [Marinithermus hydrothermalis]|uniref:Glycosyl transferase family 2 n=1 Tax=Marinithermus hydrothermalis (strain DSM 14884 / JCM 11576 / T1) TaxID=869210 RepID=F2NNJ8_MARHT|nr:glycosyltransferase [Marinithermus hydrothermalis]AEB11013.1 glycosyl transferase family 2 [Marinithermus hydrothermalis DSM 14884]
MSAIELSVIVPTHNRLELLRRKLAALEAQDLEPERFEVVVVADGCTDGTLDWLRAQRPPFALKVLETPGKGPAYARNRGAEAARGRVLVFSDDDAIPRPAWLRAHRQAHRAPRTVAVGRLVLPPALKGSGAAELAGPPVFWWNATGNNTSLSRALFQEVGGYDEGFDGYGGEDPDLGYRLLRAGARFVFVPRAEAIHEAWDHRSSALERAYKAGGAHVRVWKKHKDARIAWALGVHPALLGLKLATLPWLKGLMGRWGAYELAYARGAWEAWRRR